MLRMLMAAVLGAGLVGSAAAQTTPREDPWPYLVTNVFDDRPIADGTGIISLETPYRAEDAAIVPVTIRSELPPGTEPRIERITLLIDHNPSPVAAAFSFGEAGTVQAISTRVRVDSYSNVRAVAELSDGRLYAVANFVKASGGCSAPALKNADAQAGLGEMRFRRFERDAGMASGAADEAQIMIRHPNNSGLQMDPVTRNYVPAFFVQEVEMRIGDALLMRMEGGISISENPTFRLAYAGAEDAPVTVVAKDTEGQEFRRTWPAATGGS